MWEELKIFPLVPTGLFFFGEKILIDIFHICDKIFVKKDILE